MTQEQLALALDVDPITISRFERGVTLPSLATLHKIAGAFGVSMSDLLADTPKIDRAEADILAALMSNLSRDERDYVIDSVKKFCALMVRRRVE